MSKNAHDLTPKSANLPRLYTTENDKDPMVRVKLFTPWTGWTWLLTEYSPEDDLGFGYCHNSSDPDCAELGYVSLEELRSIKGPWGLRVERDLGFEPCKLSEAKAREC